MTLIQVTRKSSTMIMNGFSFLKRCLNTYSLYFPSPNFSSCFFFLKDPSAPCSLVLYRGILQKCWGGVHSLGELWSMGQLKHQSHVEDLVDTKSNFFFLRLWEWEDNKKVCHLLHNLQNYLGSFSSKVFSTQELILNICLPSVYKLNWWTQKETLKI